MKDEESRLLEAFRLQSSRTQPSALLSVPLKKEGTVQLSLPCSLQVKKRMLKGSQKKNTNTSKRSKLPSNSNDAMTSLAHNALASLAVYGTDSDSEKERERGTEYEAAVRSAKGISS
jgi:hypothetical protein